MSGTSSHRNPARKRKADLSPVSELTSPATPRLSVQPAGLPSSHVEPFPSDALPPADIPSRLPTVNDHSDQEKALTSDASTIFNPFEARFESQLHDSRVEAEDVWNPMDGEAWKRVLTPTNAADTNPHSAKKARTEVFDAPVKNHSDDNCSTYPVSTPRPSQEIFRSYFPHHTRGSGFNKIGGSQPEIARAYNSPLHSPVLPRVTGGFPGAHTISEPATLSQTSAAIEKANANAKALWNSTAGSSGHFNGVVPVSPASSTRKSSVFSIESSQRPARATSPFLQGHSFEDSGTPDNASQTLARNDVPFPERVAEIWAQVQGEMHGLTEQKWLGAVEASAEGDGLFVGSNKMNDQASPEIMAATWSEAHDNSETYELLPQSTRTAHAIQDDKYSGHVFGREAETSVPDPAFPFIPPTESVPPMPTAMPSLEGQYEDRVAFSNAHRATPLSYIDTMKFNPYTTALLPQPASASASPAPQTVYEARQLYQKGAIYKSGLPPPPPPPPSVAELEAILLDVRKRYEKAKLLCDKSGIIISDNVWESIEKTIEDNLPDLVLCLDYTSGRPGSATGLDGFKNSVEKWDKALGHRVLIMKRIVYKEKIEELGRLIFEAKMREGAEKTIRKEMDNEKKDAADRALGMDGSADDFKGHKTRLGRRFKGLIEKD